MPFESAIEQSLQYLRSEDARAALAADAYWPKWSHPWWHMLLLHEMGHAALIPDSTVEQHLAALSRIPLKIFPIRADELPAGVDPFRGSPCHCQLGNVYQVLSARGVDVPGELPWMHRWLLAYQMADGGMNCDNEAYLAADECPSSMVGTIAAFEALLLHAPRPWTDDVACFLERAARFLIERECRLGSPTRYNAEERTSAERWTSLCFPRFYLYDVLRGLNALTLWSEMTGRALPSSSIAAVVAHLETSFPDEVVRLGRSAWAGLRTLAQTPTGAWERRPEAYSFPLLEAVSVVGEPSPFLTQQWRETKRRIARLRPGAEVDRLIVG